MAQSRDQWRSPAGSRREHQNLRTILDTTADGIVVVDGDGIICFANRAAQELFARDADDLVGDELGFPLVAGTTIEVDVVRPRRDSRVVEMRVAAIEWEGRAACLASLRDITDRKQAELERAALVREQVARTEAEAALRARNEFLTAIAHELKTPLTRLRLTLQRARRRMAREAWQPPDYLGQALQRVELESEQVARVVDDLLRLPWAEAGASELRRDPTDLGRLLNGLVQRASARVGRDRIRVDLAAGPVVVSADRRLLEQTLASAIGNALHTSPPDQPVEVTLTVQHGDGASEASAGLARIAVRDYGPALPAEDPPRLFGRSIQVYANAYASGLGLWLHIGREVLRLHGGQVEIDYPPDGGTRVLMSLPLN